jgi:hypothetical protein
VRDPVKSVNALVIYYLAPAAKYTSQICDRSSITYLAESQKEPSKNKKLDKEGSRFYWTS